MPEGDTISRTAATLARALVGRAVTRFETGYAQLARVDDDRPLAGRTIQGVRAAGKHLLMQFSGGLTLRTHMRMSGSWHIYRPGQRWQRPRHEMRIVVETDAFVAVAFLVPVAELLDDRALARSPALRRLGPDLLAPDFDAAEALRRLRAKGDRPMGEALLDQSVVAGAGTIYRSEALFVARVDPHRRAHELDDATLAKVLAAARRLLQASVASTSREQRRWVYDRRGQPCRRCGTAITYEKMGMDARGLYWCPKCQT
jgi:endonuclease VIII